MKAKEYAQKFFDSEDKQLMIGQIFIEFVREILTVAEMRNARKGSSIKAIIEEQNQKWKALCRIINKSGEAVLKEDGFIELLKKEEPLLVEALDL